MNEEAAVREKSGKWSTSTGSALALILGINHEKHPDAWYQQQG